jgi:peptide/nickel transport system substrate-binding protein
MDNDNQSQQGWGFRRSLALLAATYLLAACGGSSDDQADGADTGATDTVDATESEEGSSSDAVAPSGTVRLAGSDWGYPQPFTHDPRKPGSYNTNLIFDSLLEKDEDGLIPWLATDWTVSDDGTVYTFELRDDVVWQDGEAFTAEDVEFSFDYYGEHSPVLASLEIDDAYVVASAEATTDDEVVVTVTEPNVIMLEALGFIRILPEHIWSGVDDPTAFTDDAAFVGTGPFRLDTFDSTQGAYRFTASDTFWGPTQKVEAIEQVPVEEEALAFKAGELDYAAVSYDVLDDLASGDGVATLTDKPYNGVRLMFNMTGPLGEVDLRHAIAYAIDQEGLIEVAARGAGIPGSAGYIPDGTSWSNPDTVEYGYDPDRAGELLAGETYRFTLHASQGDSRVAEYVAAQLEQIGITVEIIISELKANDEVIASGDYELALQSVGGYALDPDYLREVFTAAGSDLAILSSGIVGYQSDELDELAAAQLVEFDERARHDLIDQIQEILAVDLPVYTLFNKASPRVYRVDALDDWRFMYDHQWAHHAKLTYLDTTS